MKRQKNLELLLIEKDKRIVFMNIEIKNLMNLLRTLEKSIKEFDKTDEHEDAVSNIFLLFLSNVCFFLDFQHYRRTQQIKNQTFSLTIEFH